MNAPLTAPLVSLQDIFVNGPAFRTDISNETYHADRSCVSVSGMKEVLRSPEHFAAYLDGARHETAAKMFGTACHTRVLEPSEFPLRYAVLPAQIDDKRSATYKEFVAANPGKIILSADDGTTLEVIAAKVQSHQSASTLLAGGWKEVTVIWQDEETGIWIKIRPDCLSVSFDTGICLDLKKTVDASPGAFVRACVNYDYDLQAAVYLEGLRTVFKRDFDFCFLAVEEKAPNGVALYGAPADMLERGYRRFRRALHTIKLCRTMGAWPSYQPNGDYEILEWPRWAV